MKKLFTEPEIEILAFLCEQPGADSFELGGGGVDDDLPLIPQNNQ